MKILVTGAHGKVGRSLVPRLVEAGHELRTSDLTRPSWDRVDPGEPEDYVQADLTDAGTAYPLVEGCEVVIHTAAIPQPIHTAPHVVFANNMMRTFNVHEAAIRQRIPAPRLEAPYHRVAVCGLDDDSTAGSQHTPELGQRLVIALLAAVPE